ncbi:cation acetate symporter [Streptomyces griseoviridis]|uniref:Cation acetate symporter n=1 Tax=Streptomyces hintoniae TaxID=3075521 RepID=A0ABU2UBC2_9ACTN|nr:cation acetate symporter [Streptomyces sp. DSM 41014]MDT0470541.1 cation acetate symporter [Streptomyces sp. DSM 41014]
MTGFSPAAQSWSLVAFCSVVAVTLLLCVLTGPAGDDLDDFYTGYRTLSPLRNGLAVAGDYISAATVLTVGGIIALCGYDGIVLALSTLLSLMLLMFVLAEPLHNTGKFTMGDVLARRRPGRAVRITACLVTLASLVPMMVVQLAGVGQLLAFVLGFSDSTMKNGCVVGAGALMISYAALGGMRGTALIQIIKTVVLLGSGLVVTVLVLHSFGWSPQALFHTAARQSGAGPGYLTWGLQYARGPYPALDMASTQLAIVLGGACLPHVTMRMYTAGTPRQVRRAMSWAVSSVALFVLLLTLVCTGAMALLGRERIAGADPHGSTAYLLGARAAFGGDMSRAESLLFATVTTAVFLTLLASVASMTLACANTLAHDLTAGRRSPLAPARELTLARVCALAVGVPVILLAVLAQHRSLQPLATVSFCLGASAIAPALLYSLFWRRYTRAGLLATLVVGTLSVLVLMTGTSLVSGSPLSAFPDAHFDWFPFNTTALASVPAGFLAGWLTTLFTARRSGDRADGRFEALEHLLLAGPAKPAPKGPTR